MNSKIQQLAEQAGIEYANLSTGNGDNWQFAGRPEELERFAELIVRECIMICKSHKIQSTEDVWYLAHNETVNNISENIEEYFELNDERED